MRQNIHELNFSQRTAKSVEIMNIAFVWNWGQNEISLSAQFQFRNRDYENLKEIN